MKCISFVLFVVLGGSSVVGIAVNEEGNATLSGPTVRTARHILPLRIELPTPTKKVKRQVIRIPDGFSKVKLLRPPLSLRHNRAPQQFTRYPTYFRGDGPWMPPNKKPPTNLHFHLDGPSPYDPRKIKRNLKKPIVNDEGPEEFYSDDTELEFNQENQRPKKLKKHSSVVKIRRKKPKKNILGEYLANYEGDDRLNHQHGGSSHYPPSEQTHPFPPQHSSASTTHTQHLPPPSLLPHHHSSPSKTKNPPAKGRQLHSTFSQQYTTHNPHVTTNFGLTHPLHHTIQSSSSIPTHDSPLPSPTNHLLNAVPVSPPALQVIQPPQFRDVTVSHPSHPSHPSRLIGGESQLKEETSSQKATIRDILEQDCPSHDAKGYCASPPRYPMQQIKNMVKKCADLMDAMNTQPFEDPHQVLTFAKRTDDFGEKGNSSVPVDLGLDSFSTWSRTSTEEFAACNSEIELTEPGYAREVNSGRWFVIVQHPDTTIQRIATDTCRSPGKPCGGLSELKCLKVNTLPPKPTTCIQRHTNQRLISWDPESPEDCPRMRVFSFPSACTCHLGVL